MIKKPSYGYVTIAHNSNGVDYIRMANALALSLRGQEKVNNLSIIVPPGTIVQPEYVKNFDRIIEFNEDISGDNKWKIHNKWNVFQYSPYDETVLLDADMIFTMDVSDWWKAFRNFDCLACTNVLTYRSDMITSDYYRKTFSYNSLPNIYTAFL